MDDTEAQVHRWIASLRMHTTGGVVSPHKPALLLAVLDLAESGHLPDNRVVFGPPLFEAFQSYWRALAGDRPGRIEYPFWHLASEPFWTLVAVTGHEAWVADRSNAPSVRRITERVRHAVLDDGLFALVHDDAGRDRVRGAIVATHVPDRAAEVACVHRFEQRVFEYALVVLGARGAVREPAEAAVRGTAFRRVVTEAYDYTCAVSGVRLSLAGPATGHLVEAAHIRDWSDSHDDHATNGIALSPTYHWLFDNGLFTLDEQWRVRVSPSARDCLGTVDTLLTVHHDRPARLPGDRAQWPGQDYLDWHRAERFVAG
jgi:putative restriction endonuclease